MSYEYESYEYDEYDFSYEEPPKRLLRSAVVKLIEAHRDTYERMVRDSLEMEVQRQAEKIQQAQAELRDMRIAMREQEKKMAEQKARWAQRIDGGVTKPKRAGRR